MVKAVVFPPRRRRRFYAYAAIAAGHLTAAGVFAASREVGVAVALLDFACLWLAAAYASEVSW